MGLVESIMNEAYVPKPGTYKLEMTVENDGSVVIKSGDIGFRILANLIGVGSGNTKKYDEYYGQNNTDFLFFTSDKKELFN